MKIEKIPHGMVLRDRYNAVFICKSDLRKLQCDLKHKMYNNIYKTFATIEYTFGVIFIDINTAESIRIPFLNLVRLLK